VRRQQKSDDHVVLLKAGPSGPSWPSQLANRPCRLATSVQPKESGAARRRRLGFWPLAAPASSVAERTGASPGSLSGLLRDGGTARPPLRRGFPAGGRSRRAQGAVAHHVNDNSLLSYTYYTEKGRGDGVVQYISGTRAEETVLTQCQSTQGAHTAAATAAAGRPTRRRATRPEHARRPHGGRLAPRAAWPPTSTATSSGQ
jgi:hypothetical protein